MVARKREELLAKIAEHSAVMANANRSFARALSGDAPEDPAERVKWHVEQFLKSYKETLDAYIYDLGKGGERKAGRMSELRIVVDTLENICEPGKKSGVPNTLNDDVLRRLGNMLRDALTSENLFFNGDEKLKTLLERALAAAEKMRAEMFPNHEKSVMEFITQHIVVLADYCQELKGRGTAKFIGEAEVFDDLLSDLTSLPDSKTGKPRTYKKDEAIALEAALQNATTSGHEFATLEFQSQLREALRDLKKLNQSLFATTGRGLS